MPHRISQVDGIADLSLDKPSIKQIEAKETQTDVSLKTDEQDYLTGLDMDALYDEPPPTVYRPNWGEELTTQQIYIQKPTASSLKTEK